MRVKVVLVETEFGGNLGYTARAMKNFGQKELVLVNPKTRVLSGESKSRAMHALDVLKKAREAGSLKEAKKEVDFLVGMTSKTVRGAKIFRNALPLKKFAWKFGESRKTFGLVFGPEKNGLSNEQLRECDFLVTVPTHHGYRAMNLSHAVAVVLYEVSGKPAGKRFQEMNANQKRLLEKELKRILNENKTIKNKKNVLVAVKGLLSKSLLSGKEANALISLFKGRKN